MTVTEDYDHDVYSNLSRATGPERVIVDAFDGHKFLHRELERVTWKQLAQESIATLAKHDALMRMLSDWDRCEHGRHRGDSCSGTGGCDGPSLGNPHHAPGDVFGYDIGGRPYVFPAARGDGRAIEDWRA